MYTIYLSIYSYVYIYIYRICIHIIYPSWIIWLWKSDIGDQSPGWAAC